MIKLLINTIVLQESKNSSAIENIVTTQDELYKAATEEGTTSNTAKEVLSGKKLRKKYSAMKSYMNNTLSPLWRK